MHATTVLHTVNFGTVRRCHRYANSITQQRTKVKAKAMLIHYTGSISLVISNIDHVTHFQLVLGRCNTSDDHITTIFIIHSFSRCFVPGLRAGTAQQCSIHNKL